MEDKNLVWHHHRVTKKDRQKVNNHPSCVLWFTGLSGSGKSTLAGELNYYLHQNEYRSYLLDGDNVRHGLNKDLGFSNEDRSENIRRISEVAKLFVDAGVITLTAFISPFQADRDFCKSLLESGEFFEVYVKCSLETCESRDTKGLYQKAKEGIIKEFTGISSPYEEPKNPYLIIDTDKLSVEESLANIIEVLKKEKVIK